MDKRSFNSETPTEKPKKANSDKRTFSKKFKKAQPKAASSGNRTSTNNNQAKPKKQGQQPQHGQQSQQRPQSRHGQKPKKGQPSQQGQQNRPRLQNKSMAAGHKPHAGQKPNAGKNPQHTQRPKPAPKPKASQKPAGKIQKGVLRIIPVGGLNEVGKNMMALEYENDIIIIDMGFEFPSDDLLGIDYVIPDVSYLEENKKRIRGIFITHGHLDHIGGISYILPKLDYPPIYATRLTCGLISKRAEEFKQVSLMKLHETDPKETIKLGQFQVDFFRVMHSIPDAVGIEVTTPVGKIVHSGDFKFDDNPPEGQAHADIAKMKALGDKNVLALFCESTNSLKEGHSMSESEVAKVLEKAIGDAPGRIIVASFSSQIGRLQQVINAAQKHNRKIYVSGRSMRQNIDIASKLGFLRQPKEMIRDIKKYKTKDNPRETLILTTGSQGEPVSALTRMANGEHPHVQVRKGDTIILSSSPIVGNERAIYTVINSLAILGAHVIHNQTMDVHSSGHGKRDELKRMIDFVKPKYLVPIHGEYYMRQALAELATSRCNIPEDKIIMIENGNILEAQNGQVKVAKETIETKYILIDGSGEGQMNSPVQTERQMMSQNGVLTVLIYITKKRKQLHKEPDVVSRGFMYMHESQEITREVAKLAGDAYNAIHKKDPKANRRDVKQYIKQTLDKYTRQKLERRPLIVPLIIDA